jgi:hypothetical protein
MAQPLFTDGGGNADRALHSLLHGPGFTLVGYQIDVVLQHTHPSHVL